MSVTDGWFAEREVMWPGQRFSLQVKKVLHQEKSEYQDIMVFDSETYGRVLVLDGVIQLTERDEFAYQEMIAHLPLFAHAAPEAVLIVGGGDGGVLREVCRHKSVKKIVMCEIDRRVCDVSKEFFSGSMSTAFGDPRVQLLYMDAAIYMREHKAEFDCIIVDSSDPVGPAETLYTSSFYRDMHSALRAGGVVCTQGECQWLHLPLIKRVMADAGALYPVVDYAYSCVPTYPNGQIGFIIASTATGGRSALRTPRRAVPAELAAQLRYYSAEAHAAAFVLPAFAAKELVSVRADQTSAASGCAASCGCGCAAGGSCGSAGRASSSSSTITTVAALAAAAAVGAAVLAAVLSAAKKR